MNSLLLALSLAATTVPVHAGPLTAAETACLERVNASVGKARLISVKTHGKTVIFEHDAGTHVKVSICNAGKFKTYKEAKK